MIWWHGCDVTHIRARQAARLPYKSGVNPYTDR